MIFIFLDQIIFFSYDIESSEIANIQYFMKKICLFLKGIYNIFNLNFDMNREIYFCRMEYFEKNGMKIL